MPVDESNRSSPSDAEQSNRQPWPPQAIEEAASGSGNSWLSRRWLIRIGLAIAALLILVISLWTSRPFIPRADIRASSRTSAALGSVVSLGRIEPEDGIITLSARSLMGQPSLVSELRVKEGDYVQRGQVLAILDSSAQLEGAWREAEGRLGLAQTQLEQVEAGAKTGDLAAQAAEIERTKAELANAENEQHRNHGLEWLTVGWMVIEAAVAIGAGVMAGSLVLLAFGLDSVIELISASVLIWRLSVELRHGQTFSDTAERTASRNRRRPVVRAGGLRGGVCRVEPLARAGRDVLPSWPRVGAAGDSHYALSRPSEVGRRRQDWQPRHAGRRYGKHHLRLAVVRRRREPRRSSPARRMVG